MALSSRTNRDRERSTSRRINALSSAPVDVRFAKYDAATILIIHDSIAGLPELAVAKDAPIP